MRFFLRMLISDQLYCIQFSSVAQFVSDSLRPHESQHARPPCPSPTPGVHSNSYPSSKSVTPSSHLILSCPLLLLPPIPPSIRVFSNESTCMRWPKYWSFSFSIIPFKEIPGLISLRMHWLDLLAVQGSLKSLLQQHSSKTTERPLLISKANHSISQLSKSMPQPVMLKNLRLNGSMKNF